MTVHFGRLDCIAVFPSRDGTGLRSRLLVLASCFLEMKLHVVYYEERSGRSEDPGL
jgi:hypothetical protein